MINRRNLLKKLSTVPLLGTFATPLLANTAPELSAAAKQRDLFKELGLRTFINCAGPFTSMTGCLMPEEVLDTIKASGRQYVDLDELQDRVGERIALLLDCEAAVVSSGLFRSHDDCGSGDHLRYGQADS